MPEVAEPPPLTAPDKGLQAIASKSSADIAALFTGPGINRDGKVVAEPSKPAPKIEEPVKKEEPPKTDIPKVDATKTEPPKEAPKTKEDSIVDLRTGRDEARKQYEAEKAARELLAKELEELKKRPDPKEFQEKLAQTEKEKAEYQRQLQAASLERDPEFQKEYDSKINGQAKTMLTMLVAAGVADADAKTAVGAWNERFFAEQMDSMDALTRVKFQGAWAEAERLHNERQGKIAQAESTWQERQKQQQEAQAKQGEEYQRFLHGERDAVLKEFGDMEGLKGNEEFLKGAAEAVNASFNAQPRELMKQVAAAHLLAKSVTQKDGEITALKEKLAALEKENNDNKTFIKEQHGAVPRIGPSGGEEPAPDKKALAAQFLNPTFGGR